MKYHIGQKVYVYVSIPVFSEPAFVKFYVGKIKDCPKIDAFSDKQELFIEIVDKVFISHQDNIDIGYIWNPSTDEDVYLIPSYPTEECVKYIFENIR